PATSASSTPRRLMSGSAGCCRSGWRRRPSRARSSHRSALSLLRSRTARNCVNFAKGCATSPARDSSSRRISACSIRWTGTPKRRGPISMPSGCKRSPPAAPTRSTTRISRSADRSSTMPAAARAMCATGERYVSSRNERPPLQPEIKFADELVVVELVGVAALEGDLAVHDDVAAIGDADGLIEVLLGHQYGQLKPLLQFLDLVDRATDEDRGETDRRLVDQQDARRRHQGARQRQHLLLAAGEAAGELAAALAQAREGLVRGFEIALDQAARRRAERAQQQILLDVQLGEQAPAFRHKGDAEIDNLLGRAADEIIGCAVDLRPDRPG